MIKNLVIPSSGADADEWCRWAWLMGRQSSPEPLAQLREVVSAREQVHLVRQTALGSYWMLSEVHDAMALEVHLLEQQQWHLAVYGLNHPRWWHDSQWVDACQNWVGLDDTVDRTVFRLASWDYRPLAHARIPHHVYERVGSIRHPVDWDQALVIGEKHIRDPKPSGFVGFWEKHITDWAEQWFRWEEAVWLYRWRIQEEQQLVEWTHSEPYGAAPPPIPIMDCPRLSEARTVQESTRLMMLGSGYQLGAKDSSDAAAAWDSIWSSWAASLNYALFDILSNVQTTEWHVAGLTGSLRDQSRAQRWGLRLD